MPFRSHQLSDHEQSFLKRLSKILADKEKQVFRAKSLGLKQKEIAFILGISQGRVSQVLKKVENLANKTAQTTDNMYRGV